MDNIKLVCKYIYKFISRIFLGAFFITLLLVAQYLTKNYDFQFESLIKASYYVVGIGVLYYIGKGMEVKKIG